MPAKPSQKQWKQMWQDIPASETAFWRFTKQYWGICRGVNDEDIGIEPDPDLIDDPHGEGFEIIGDLRAKRANIANCLKALLGRINNCLETLREFRGWTRGEALHLNFEIVDYKEELRDHE